MIYFVDRNFSEIIFTIVNIYIYIYSEFLINDKINEVINFSIDNEISKINFINKIINTKIRLAISL